jgi:hypothetical protein
MEVLEFALWKKKTRKELGLHNEGQEEEKEPENPVVEQKPLDMATRLDRFETRVNLILDTLKGPLNKKEEYQKLNDMIVKMDELNKSLMDLITKLDSVGLIKGGTGQLGESSGNISLTKRLQDVLDIVKTEGTITPTKLSQKLNCSTATSCEFLRKLTKLGKLKLVKRGTYKVNEAS